MRSRLTLLLIALAAVLLLLPPTGCKDDNNVTGPGATPTSPPATATPTSPPVTATATSPPTTATATRTATPAATTTPTLTPTSPALAYAGNWTGSWMNQTFGSSGPASFALTINTSAQTFQGVLTLGGNVFGAGPPPPQTFSGSYTSPSFSQSSPLFGNVSATFTSPNSFAGNATNIPNPNIARMDFTGTVSPQTITVNYTITFSPAGGGGTAQGVLTLNHV